MVRLDYIGAEKGDEKSVAFFLSKRYRYLTSKTILIKIYF